MMPLRLFPYILFVVLVLTGVTHRITSAQEIIFDRSGLSSPTLEIETDDLIFDRTRVTDLELSFKYRIPNTPEGIRTALLYDRKGRELDFRVLLDKDLELILGTALKGIVFEVLHSPRKGVYTILGRKDGKPYRFTKDDLQLLDTRFREKCMDLVNPSELNIPNYIGIAIDISGSMRTFTDDLERSLSAFLQTVPEQSFCQIIQFDGRMFYVDPQSSRLVNSAPPFTLCSKFRDINIQSYNGDTYITPPTTALYEALRQKNEGNTLLLLLTDGQGNPYEEPRISGVLKLREQAEKEAGVYSIINWMGVYDQNYPISKIANDAVFGIGGKEAGEKFFDHSKGFIGGQQQVAVRECTPD